MIGFIGCGNMARAIIQGMIGNKITKAEGIIASAATDSTRDFIVQKLGINAAKTNTEVVEKSDIIFFGIKPQVMERVIEEIKELDLSGKTFVSMAPGKSFEWFKEKFGKSISLVRTAPNTPLMCAAGMTSICANALTPPDKLDYIKNVFGSLGRTAAVEEKLLDVALAVSGSSPAFVFMFIEALADGAVAEGMPRALAYELASQAVLGSGKLAVESGKIPAQLKDEVTSPAGTTIEGINILEEDGFRGAVIDAVRASIQKAKNV